MTTTPTPGFREGIEAAAKVARFEAGANRALERGARERGDNSRADVFKAIADAVEAVETAILANHALPTPPAQPDPEYFCSFVAEHFGARQAGCWRCGALSELLCRMLTLSGFPARVVKGHVDEAGHVWVEVEGKIYDPTRDQFSSATPIYIPDAPAQPAGSEEASFERMEQAAAIIGDALPTSAQPGKPIVIDYTNWNGKRRIRTVRPLTLFFGNNQWYPTPQWLLLAHDEDGTPKTFAVSNIHAWGDQAASAQPAGDVERVADLSFLEPLEAKARDQISFAKWRSVEPREIMFFPDFILALRPQIEAALRTANETAEGRGNAETSYIYRTRLDAAEAEIARLRTALENIERCVKDIPSSLDACSRIDDIACAALAPPTGDKK